MLNDEGLDTSQKLSVVDDLDVHGRRGIRKLPTNQGGISDSSCFDSDTITCDLSEDMAKGELRGRDLYDRLMIYKPTELSEYEWADRIGVSRSYFNDIKTKGGASSPAKLTKVMASVGKTLGELYGFEPQPAIANVPFNPHDLPRDVPIYGTAMGADLEFEQNGEVARIEETLIEDGAVGFARRPPAIDSNRKAYALYIVGDSMLPRYRPGDLVYVDPRRAPQIGDDVIVQLIGNADPEADPAELRHVLVKQLVRSTASHFELEQFNPSVVFRVPKNRVHAIHRVIPLSELLS